PLLVHARGRHLGAGGPAGFVRRRDAGGSATGTDRRGRAGRPERDGAGAAWLGRAQAVQVLAVVLAVRSQAGGELQVAARLDPVAGQLERAAEAEVGVVVDRRALDHRGELVARLGVAPRVEVGAAERLADRGLVRLERARLLERDRRGREVAALQQIAAAAEQVVHVLAALLGIDVVFRHDASAAPGACPPRSLSTASTIARAI